MDIREMPEPGDERSDHSRVPVSIVCVYNDPAVLDACLRRSVELGLPSAPHTEFLPIDNREQQFTSAGAALNHGARMAKNPVVAFPHQDVFLHSLERLEEVAGRLAADPRIGIAGAVGTTSDDRVVGRIRDRVLQIGERAPDGEDVDSLDEVLIVISRERVLADPISEDPELAWHAYAVEYCARTRAREDRAIAIDIPLTHNSLTTNLRHLDVAHEYVGSMYPDLLPITTTCGVILAEQNPITSLRQRTVRARTWLATSQKLQALTAFSPNLRPVILDIRMAIDALAELMGSTSILICDASDGHGTPDQVDGFERFGRSVSIVGIDVDEIEGKIAERSPDELVLITGLDSDLPDLPIREGRIHMVGTALGIDVWMVPNVDPDVVDEVRDPFRRRPFGI